MSKQAAIPLIEAHYRVKQKIEELQRISGELIALADAYSTHGARARLTSAAIQAQACAMSVQAVLTFENPAAALRLSLMEIEAGNVVPFEKPNAG